jgi:hypothetical protein
MDAADNRKELGAWKCGRRARLLLLPCSELLDSREEKTRNCQV